MKQTKEKKKRSGSMWLITIALLLFILRYIPIYKSNYVLFTKTYSLAEGVKLCSGALNNSIISLVPQCSWITPLNIFLWAVIVVLLVIGIIGLFRK